MAIEKKSNRVVGQSNRLVRSIIYDKLTINDLKVFKAVISKINYRDSLFEDFYMLNYKELDVVGIGTKNRFERITEILKKLASTYVYYTDEKGKKRQTGLIQNDFRYEERTSYIEIKVHESLKTQLLELKNIYTKYNLENISKFKNMHTLKLYEILKSWEAHKDDYKPTLENLRKILEIGPDEYILYGNFKQRILAPALNTINKYTDINVEVEEAAKVARKVTSLTFKIKAKEKKSEEDKNFEKEFDLTKLIDKIFIDKKSTKYLVKGYISNKAKKGFYGLELLNIHKSTDVRLEPTMKKKELYNIVIGRIKDFEVMKEAKEGKKKLENMLKSMNSKTKSSNSMGSTPKTLKPFQSSKAPVSRLADMTQQERIDNFTKGNKK